MGQIRNGQSIHVLMIEDDEDDALLTSSALAELNHRRFEVIPAKSLEEGLFCLEHNPADVVLLDLNMPRKDGREAAQEIMSDPKLRRIPIAVLTTSRAEEDICRSYDLGVSSYITKPVTFEGLVEVMRTLGSYWFEIVELPGRKPATLQKRQPAGSTAVPRD